MNDILIYILVLILAYLLGSIPFALVIGKLFYKTDVRQHGSKNAGATNVFRVLGAVPAISVLLLDVCKAGLAVYLAIILNPEIGVFASYLPAAAAVAAMLGHSFPVFAGFKGGKGVACMLGIGMLLFPWAILTGLGIFVIVLLPSRYVSLSSITAAISFPFILYFIFGENDPGLIVLSILAVLSILLLHIPNIKRLLKGTENRIQWKKK